VNRDNAFRDYMGMPIGLDVTPIDLPLIDVLDIGVTPM
jgi:hypothetical protein